MVVLYKKIIEKLKQLSINLRATVLLDTNTRYGKVLAKIKRTNKANHPPPHSQRIFTVQDTSAEQNRDSDAVNRNQTGNTFRIRENKNPKQKRFFSISEIFNFLHKRLINEKKKTKDLLNK